MSKGHAAASLEDHDGGQDDRGAASEDSDDGTIPYGHRALQVLAVRANFPIHTINGYDWHFGRSIYVPRKEEEVQKEGMVDLIPIGPGEVFMADVGFTLEVFPCTTAAGDTTATGEEERSSKVGSPITEGWDVCGEDGDDEPEEFTVTISRGPGRMLEITFLLIPKAIEARFEVRLKLGSRSRAVYGKIKASAAEYGDKSVHLCCWGRGSSWSVPSGSSSWILPLTPSVIAVPCRRHLELDLEVDLTIVAISDDQQEEEKNLKFTGLKFTNRVRSHEREVDGDQVEVNVLWQEIYI